jgi:hypothetical protein
MAVDLDRRIAFAIVVAFAVTSSAAAEPIRVAQIAMPGVLPSYEIITIVRSAGLDPLSRPYRSGPNYVMRAVGGDGEELRVLVDARSGRIVSMTPIDVASYLPPEAIADEGEPLPMTGRLPSGRREFYDAQPRIVHEDGRRVIYEDEPEPPAIYGLRPPAHVAMPKSMANGATPPPREDAPAVSEPRVITAIEPGREGLLPPPPERFPRRTPATADKPKPAKRAVAELPMQPPLPRPRLGVSAAPSAPNVTGKSAIEQLPN